MRERIDQTIAVFVKDAELRALIQLARQHIQRRLRRRYDTRRLQQHHMGHIRKERFIAFMQAQVKDLRDRQDADIRRRGLCLQHADIP